MRKILRKAGILLKDNIKTLVRFELLFKVITIIVMLPILVLWLETSLHYAHFSYLTSNNIAEFIKAPFTLIGLLVILLIGSLLGLIELTGIFICMENRKRKIKIKDLLFFSMERVYNILKFKNILILIVPFLLFPLANVSMISIIFSKMNVPNYFFRTLSKMKNVRQVVIIFAVIGIYIIMRLAFSVYDCLLGRKSCHYAFKKSIELTKNQMIKNLLCIVIWNLGFMVVSSIIYLIVCCLVATWIALFSGKIVIMAKFLTAHEWIVLGMAVFNGVMGSIANYVLIAGVYKNREEELGKEVVKNKYRLDYKVGKHHRIIKKILLYITIMLLVFNGMYTVDIIRNGMSTSASALKLTEITSHRGSSKNAPENTIEAIECAIDEMSDYVEIDVQETKDQVVILMHDSSLKRTTGYNKKVKNTTYEKIMELDAGSWFGHEYTNTKIPTLEEVMQYSKGKIKLNIEIKNDSRIKHLTKQVVELIEKYDMENQCVITCSSIDCLENVKEINPDIRTGYILLIAYGNFYDDSVVDFFSIRAGFVNDYVISQAHKRGKEVHVWTVNTEEEMGRIHNIGADNIITDRPVKAREIIYEDKNNKNLAEFLRMLLKN